MHFPRFLSLFIALIGSSFTWAQEQSTEAFWTYNEGATQMFEVWYAPNEEEKVALQLDQAEILDVRLSEGRLKQSLNYTYSDQVLKVSLPNSADSKARVYLKYQIPWTVFETSAFITPLEPGFMLNALNSEVDQGNGMPGILIPAPINQKPQFLRLALALPKDYYTEHHLLEDFKLLEGGREVVFLYSEGPVEMTDFYLTISKIKNFDPKDYLANLEAQERAMEDQRIDAFQGRHLDVINYVAETSNWNFSREGMLGLSGIEPSRQDPAFPAFSMTGTSLQSDRINLAIIEEFFKDNWQWHWANFNKARSTAEDWRAYLFNKRENGDTTNLFWNFYLEEYLSERSLSWSDTASTVDSIQRIYLDQALYFLNKKEAVNINLNYRLNFSEKGMNLLCSHSDTNHLAFQQFRGWAYFQSDSTYFTVGALIASKDTLLLPLKEAPRAIYLDEDPWGLVRIKENRPLNFLLFDLSNRNKPEYRRKAVLQLLDRSNAKLKATVVGIALDSGEKELQHLALSKVKELQPEGKQRLKATIEALAAQNEDVKLKQKAAEVLDHF